MYHQFEMASYFSSKWFLIKVFGFKLEKTFALKGRWFPKLKTTNVCVSTSSLSRQFIVIVRYSPCKSIIAPLIEKLKIKKSNIE